MPLSQFEEFWAYQTLRHQDDAHNPAVGRQMDPLIDMIAAAFGAK